MLVSSGDDELEHSERTRIRLKRKRRLQELDSAPVRIEKETEHNKHSKKSNNVAEDLHVEAAILPDLTFVQNSDLFADDVRAVFEESEDNYFSNEDVGDSDSGSDAERSQAEEFEFGDTDDEESEEDNNESLGVTEQPEIEVNINLFEHSNHQNNAANEELDLNSLGYNLNHSNLDTVVNAREGTTAKDLLVLALALSVRHNWNYEELIHYLESQNTILEIPCLPQSKTKLFSILRRQASELTFHAYCPKCGEYLNEKKKLGRTVKCKNVECEAITVKLKLKYFVTLDLKSQLQRFLAIPSIADKLDYRKSRNKRKVDSIQDIFDGSEYKRLLSDGVISDNDFTYIFNTDGVKFLKGAKGSAWPLYIRINELPPTLRQKYLFLAGVWVDSIEPIMNTFLQPFVDQANILSSEGVLWKPDRVRTVVSKFVPVCQCVDSKARYTLYNMSQFNAGSGGCTFCTAQGVQSGGTRYPVLPPSIVSHLYAQLTWLKNK